MPEQPELPTISQLVANAPRYFAGYLKGFVFAILTDVVITSLFLGSVALGFATTPLWAIATFLVLYALMRTVNSVANAIGTSGQILAQAHVAAQQPPISATDLAENK